jgi:hypothetical protein
VLTCGPGAQGARARSGIPRSGPCDRDRTEGIKLGRGERLQAALLLSTAVRLPELRQAQARVALGSPRLGREGENTMTNSMAGKRPRLGWLWGHRDWAEREGERGKGRSGQRLSNWRTGPASQRERRSARVKELAPTGRPHWAASERGGRGRESCR